jgi:hypothetical protein
MTFLEGLRNARSHIIFLAAMLSAGGLILALQAWEPSAGTGFKESLQQSAKALPALSAPRPLTNEEREWARVAWTYFKNNYQPSTGLANSVDKYPASTMWDTGSFLMAVISAHRLGLIEQTEFDDKMSRALVSLAKIPLFDGKLPNKNYNTISLAMVDYTNKPTVRGLGWSAIDVGRLLVPFNIVLWNYPAHSGEVRSVLQRWDMSLLLKQGQLHGAAVDAKGNTIYLQEGRFGYEQYSAKSFSLMGRDVSNALSYYDHLKLVTIDGVRVPTDNRSADQYHAHVYAVSEPYILDGLEFGWDASSRSFAHSIYDVQRRRFQRTGILTAVSEDNLDQPPYFAYNTVWADGKSWNTITDEGKDVSQFRSLSTKAAMGWLVLYRDDYTAHFQSTLAGLFDRAQGWFAGRYERDGKQNRALTSNTNAIVLESLCYLQNGIAVRMY